MENDKLYCPNCGSSQLSANKKGFGAGKALTGAILTGGVGLLAGFIGSGNIKITCLQCGSKWSPGQLRTTPLSASERKNNDKTKIIVFICCIIFMIIYMIFDLIVLYFCD